MRRGTNQYLAFVAIAAAATFATAGVSVLQFASSPLAGRNTLFRESAATAARQVMTDLRVGLVAAVS